MARVTKIDNSVRKRLQRDENKKRTVDTRDKVIYFLIVCEGTKTEPSYFRELQKELPKGVIELKIEGSGLNTLSLIDFAIKQRDTSVRKFDRVWAVFDKDDFPDENFNTAVYKALGNGIQCAWTNEAFELWFLLHFIFVNAGMKRQRFKEVLEDEIRKKTGNQKYTYEKNSEETYSLLKTHGNKDQAIKWAKKLASGFSDEKYASHNPCTLVHLLIEELYNPAEVLRYLAND